MDEIQTGHQAYSFTTKGRIDSQAIDLSQAKELMKSKWILLNVPVNNHYNSFTAL